MGAEWTYLLTTRKVAGDDSAFSYVRLQYGSNPTDTVTGTIIYPDDFSFADAGVGAMPFGAKYAVRQIDADAWEALEEAGCVFLPSNRFRSLQEGVPTITEGFYGIAARYWSATAYSAATPYNMYFSFSSDIYPTSTSNDRYYGMSIRLVQDY